MADLTTLANVKEWLKVTGTADDALLTRLVSAASGAMQTWMNRVIASGSYTEYRDGHDGIHLSFSDYPVTAVSGVSINDIPIPASTGSLSSGYVFSATRLSLRGFYVFDRGVQNVLISYTAGYAVTPPELAQACIELVSARYKEKDRIGLVSKGLAGETITFSQKDFSAGVRTVMSNYKKVVSL